MKFATKKSVKLLLCLMLCVVTAFSLCVISFATEGDTDTALCVEHIRQEKADAQYLVSAADCENAAVYNASCEICGKVLEGETFTYGKPLYHLYMLERVSVRAGIDKDGATNFYCVRCDKQDNAPIPFAGIKTVALAQNTFAFSGKEITPEVTVTDKNGVALKKDTDYTVSYKNNRAPGKASVTLTFIGKYEGSQTLGFTISELSATAKLNCKVQTNEAALSWSEVAGATGYKVYIKTADGKYTQKSTAATSLTVKELTPATKYTFVIKAYATVDGKEYVSSASKAVTCTTKPLAVSTLTAVAGKTAVALKWSSVDGADSYKVYMYNSKTKKTEPYKTVKGTAVKVEGLEGATTYAFKVTAVKNGTEGASVSIKATTKPAAVKSLTATASASAVALKWSKVKGADSYSVYMYNAKTKKYDLYKTVTGTSLKITELESAKTYAFKVIAVRAGVTGSSVTVKATTKPLAVKTLTATASTSAVALKWSKVKGADSYKVYMYNSKTKKYDLYKTVTGTSLKIEGLDSAKTYAFKVAAVKNGVNGASVTVKATTRPAAVKSLTATVSTSAVALKWSKVKGADSYRVYKYNAKTKKYDLYKTVTDTNIKIKKLDSAKTYAFKVAAVKNGVEGARVTVKATTKPLAPATLKVSTDTVSAVLKWSKVKGADSYNVYIRNQKTKTYELYKTVTATSLKIEKLAAATEYTFAVRAVKSGVTGSAAITKTATKPLAVKELNTNVSASAVALKWSRVAGADSYNVYKYNAKTKTYELYKTVNDTALTVTGLDSGVTYAFAVRAVKAGFTGGAKTVSATTKPLPVTVLNAASTESSVTLTWEKVSSADEYRVYRYNAKIKDYELCKSVTATSLTVTGLESETEYIFSVITVKLTADGEATLGAKKNITVKTKAAAPARPEKIAVSAKDGKATVRWTAVDGIDGYQVAYKDGKTGKNVLMGEVKPGEEILVKDGFTKGVQYVFGVRSFRIVDGERVYSSFKVKTVTMK